MLFKFERNSLLLHSCFGGGKKFSPSEELAVECLVHELHIIYRQQCFCLSDYLPNRFRFAVFSEHL